MIEWEKVREVPETGTSGQVLTKTENGYEFDDISVREVPETGITGQVLTKTEDGYEWDTPQAPSNVLLNTESAQYLEKLFFRSVISPYSVLQLLTSLAEEGSPGISFQLEDPEYHSTTNANCSIKSDGVFEIRSNNTIYIDVSSANQNKSFVYVVCKKPMLYSSSDMSFTNDREIVNKKYVDNAVQSYGDNFVPLTEFNALKEEIDTLKVELNKLKGGNT